MSFFSSILGFDGQHNASVADSQAKGLRNQATNAFGSVLSQSQSDRQRLGGQVQGAQGAFQKTLGSNPLLQAYQTGHSNNPLLQALGAAGGINLGQGDNSFIHEDASQLTPAQGALLNSHIGRITQQRTSAIESFRQQAASRGVDPSAVAAQERLIGENYDQSITDTTNQFQEQARQDRLAALQSLIGQGQSAYGQNLSGEFDYASQLIGQQNTADNNTLNAGQSIQGQANARQGEAQQYQASANAGFGNLLQLGGFALGGGFKKQSGTPGIAP